MCIKLFYYKYFIFYFSYYIVFCTSYFAWYYLLTLSFPVHWSNMAEIQLSKFFIILLSHANFSELINIFNYYVLVNSFSLERNKILNRLMIMKPF